MATQAREPKRRIDDEAGERAAARCCRSVPGGGGRHDYPRYALRAGFGARNERAGRAEMRTRDAADGLQFRRRREHRLTVGRTACGGRRVTGLGDEHTEPHGRISQRTIALVIGRMPTA
ncbi:hypothetical protein [Burkholderia catarinensis]|uniref:hypothetical protein n=1 Tax=Burkholderia catarinensis TaxID=1108140 RepID=UPI001C594273|nr:hypothetical protein [Burkholderia catarinensis]